MALFDFLKKKAEPVVKKAEPVLKNVGINMPQAEKTPVEVPKKPALVLNESELMAGFPRLTRFEISAMDKEYYNVMDLEEEDKLAAFQPYMELAKKGHPNAMNSIAYYYAFGDGVEKNEEEYLKWMCRAASAGDEASMIKIAEEYEAGNVDYDDDERVILEKDPVASFMWYLRASRQEIYYDEYDEDEEETDEDYDDELIMGDEEELEPYSPNKEYVENAQNQVKEIIDSIHNGTFEGTPQQAEEILKMYQS